MTTTTTTTTVANTRTTASPSPARRRNPVSLLRVTGLVEGVSFLVLLGVAMPLKYLAGLPGAVKAVGWAHGVLFVAFGVALLYVTAVARWSIARAALVVAAAFVPFGPFAIDRRMRQWEAEFDARSVAPGG